VPICEILSPKILRHQEPRIPLHGVGSRCHTSSHKRIERAIQSTRPARYDRMCFTLAFSRQMSILQRFAMPMFRAHAKRIATAVAHDIVESQPDPSERQLQHRRLHVSAHNIVRFAIRTYHYFCSHSYILFCISIGRDSCHVQIISGFAQHAPDRYRTPTGRYRDGGSCHHRDWAGLPIE
jgi:hypothetical protein